MTARGARQHADPLSDLDIARAAKPKPIAQVAADGLGLPPESLVPYGRDKAKLDLAAIPGLAGRPGGKLVLVTAITPTPAGEGKTTTTVGLGDALAAIGKRAAVCLREPSLGPCFGMKGGAAGGGYAQVVPMEDINLHFTGDFHAIGAAHNLLAALADNHIHWGGAPALDPRRVSWRRVVDMNDRALRRIVSSLGGAANGVPREDGFDITVASEVMAVLCLARGLEDLRSRLGEVVVGATRAREPVRAADLSAAGPMTALLRDALKPNLVQTLEGTPAFVHGWPFANIAHGCNSVAATGAALKTRRLRRHRGRVRRRSGGGEVLRHQMPAGRAAPPIARWSSPPSGRSRCMAAPRAASWGAEDAEAVARGTANLARHVKNVRRFGVPAVVAVNRFSADAPAELAAVARACDGIGVEAVSADHWAEGGAGAEALARAVVRAAEGGEADFRPLYADGLPLWEKLRTVAREDLRRRRHRRRQAGARPLRRIGGVRFRALAGLRRQDAIQFLDRPGPQGRAERPHRPRPRIAASPPAPGSRWRCAATS